VKTRDKLFGLAREIASDLQVGVTIDEQEEIQDIQA